MKNPQKLLSKLTQCSSNLNWRFILLLIPPISLLLFLSTTSATGFNPFYYFNNPHSSPNPGPPPVFHSANVTERKKKLERSRIAVCLVGGARRFELTGPSIVQKVLEVYPNSDLFLNSPLDSDSYKFSLLKTAPRIAAVRVLKPSHIPVTDADVRVLTAKNSPNGIQGLLQYFNLVEGCLNMIQSYQHRHNFTYHWIIRTRVDAYWSAPLSPQLFIPTRYVVPSGSSYGGFNDRFGIGDYNTSLAALSRLSMLSQLHAADFRHLNSESALQAQLTLRNITCLAKQVPFCVVSDRRYRFPPRRLSVPVAAISSKGPLNGVKCRPCTPVCSSRCAAAVTNWLDRDWRWIDGGNGRLQLCDARGKWEDGWQAIFDGVAGNKLAAARKRVSALSFSECVADFEEMRRRTATWEAPPTADVCRIGLGSIYA